MKEDMKLDSKKTAFLTLDLQYGILGMVPNAESVVSTAARAVQFARDNHLPIIHVGLGFSEGHPEIPDSGGVFSMVKQNNLFVKGTPSVEFHSAIMQPGDLVVYKQRISAFSENHLRMILRAGNIGHLVLFGVSTSGIVLSTARQAFDLDFRCVILKDACFDPDEEVHRVLTEKIFPMLASVSATEEFIAGQEARIEDGPPHQ
jgi:nicotinamidase-related amidase